ncbi:MULTISPECIES: hypothetical protein [unclassified Embleya]
MNELPDLSGLPDLYGTRVLPLLAVVLLTISHLALVLGASR